jgi:hypothetical protein
MTMTRLEVRCCCQPRKVLGWLEVPEHQVREGNSVRFTIPPTWRPERVLLADTIALPVATITEYGRDWLAFKAEGAPVERLRKLPGFMENTNDEN